MQYNRHPIELIYLILTVL